MSSSLSKAVATCVIWLGAAGILAFGVWRMSGDFLLHLAAGALVLLFAVGTTVVIWVMRPGGPGGRRRRGWEQAPRDEGGPM